MATISKEKLAKISRASEKIVKDGKKQAEELAFDFDKSFQEYSDDISNFALIKFEGETYKVCRDAPADAILFLRRMSNAQGEVQEKDYEKYLRMLLPADFMNAIESSNRPFIPLMKDVGQMLQDIHSTQKKKHETTAKNLKTPAS